MALNADIFAFCPTYEPQKNMDPRLLTAKFGDGYQQDAPDGLNYGPMAWALSFESETQDNADAMDSFLMNHIGRPFYWVEPSGRIAALYKCSSWDVRTVGPKLYTVTAKLLQSFDLPNQLQPFISTIGPMGEYYAWLQALSDTANGS
jgi:phage-related protein